MARDPGQFFNISTLGVRLAWMLLALVVFELIYGSVAVIDFLTYSNADPLTYDPNTTFSEGYLTYSTFAGFGYALVYLATMIAAGIWIYRAAFNARAAGDDMMRPGWAVGWYFIPIMNLFKPYQSMKQVWGTTFGGAGVPGFFGWWWGMWLVTNILAQISVRIFQSAPDTEAFAVSAGIDIVNVPIGIAVAVLFRRIVRQITIGQHGWDAGGAPVAKVFE